MNRTAVDQIANAVLYEGYILYPYRPSVKNQQRWTFGGLFPEAFCEAQQSGDAAGNQTECLVHGGPATMLEVIVRFLHLTARQVWEPIGLSLCTEGAAVNSRRWSAAEPPEPRRSNDQAPEARPNRTLSDTVAPPGLPDLDASIRGLRCAPPPAINDGRFAAKTADFHWPDDMMAGFRPVESLRVGGKLHHTWQEAEEREITAGDVTLGELLDRPRTQSFGFSGGRRMEPLTGTNDVVHGVLIREQHAVSGEIELAAAEVAEGLYRITLIIVNRTPWKATGGRERDAAQLRSLVSTHALLGVRDGAFVSLLDPPETWRDAAAGCRNVGTWPVLVGEGGRTDTILSSPIILYDYPQVAPESPGDFFDGAEIDEMLTLRIMTLTDEEKRSMAATDDRAGSLLARTEALAREQLMSLHGTMREVPRG